MTGVYLHSQLFPQLMHIMCHCVCVSRKGECHHWSWRGNVWNSGTFLWHNHSLLELERALEVFQSSPVFKKWGNWGQNQEESSQAWYHTYYVLWTLLTPVHLLRQMILISFYRKVRVIVPGEKKWQSRGLNPLCPIPGFTVVLPHPGFSVWPRQPRAPWKPFRDSLRSKQFSY